MIIFSESARSYQTWGNLRALEGIFTQPGDFWLIIYRPFCGNNTDCNLGIISCSPPEVFCYRTKTCVKAESTPRTYTDPGPCRQPIDFFPEYHRIRRVKITGEKDYTFYRLKIIREFQTGDLVALKPISDG